MKMLAALATMGLIAAIGTSDGDATSKTARLTDPPAVGTDDASRTSRLRESGALAIDRAAASARLGLSEIELEGIETAVRGQIEALARRDAEGAYSFLTPLIQDYYADAGSFLGALDRELGPVMQAERFALAGLEREALDAIQRVIFKGAEGEEWLARFKLERQLDGAWRVKSCQVEPLAGRAI